jgi:hypothetical protein
MAIIHRAYSFDPIVFHSMLQEKLMKHNQFSLDTVLDLARTIVSNAPENTKRVLEDMRFDDVWLDTSDDEISHTNEWYMIALAQNLSPAPSLSNRLQVSHIVLKLILPITGWTDTEVELLLRGQLLDTLVESSGNTFFINEFRGLKQYGGWLSVDDIKSLLFRLQGVERYFSSPSREAEEALAKFAVHWSLSPGEMMRKAYADAREMLQTAIERNSALFVLLD